MRPLRVSRNVIRIDAPVMVFFTALFMLFAIDNRVIDRWEGVFFVSGLVVYTLFTYAGARRQPQVVADDMSMTRGCGWGRGWAAGWRW